MSDCPLCGASGCTFFSRDVRRDYLRCAQCALVFVPPEQRLSASDERAQYDLHENDPSDLAYRGFLSRMFLPMCERVPVLATGLDFGSGPGPTLSVMFEEAGYDMAIYDPFYAPDTGVFERQYDFITATEVVEHMHRPGWELSRLVGLLEPGGYLGVMTKRVTDVAAFSTWHYKDDPTHVCFFSTATFEWLAKENDCEIVLVDRDVVIMRRRGFASRA
jgi:hypothetical protein